MCITVVCRAINCKSAEIFLMRFTVLLLVELNWRSEGVRVRHRIVKSPLKIYEQILLCHCRLANAQCAMHTHLFGMKLNCDRLGLAFVFGPFETPHKAASETLAELGQQSKPSLLLRSSEI